MILFWNDVKSFTRHLENMRRFRQQHRANGNYRWGTIKDMPMMRDIHVSAFAGGARFNVKINDRRSVLPLWKTMLPRNIQN